LSVLKSNIKEIIDRFNYDISQKYVPTEQDIQTKYILPMLDNALNWDTHNQNEVVQEKFIDGIITGGIQPDISLYDMTNKLICVEVTT
jgi:hypothetical protein